MENDTDQLLRRFSNGESDARDELLERYRSKLKRVVEIRMDPRLANRLDASDVVQETLVEANKKLAAYAVERPIAFYPWLRQILWNRLVDVHRHHFAQKRDVTKDFEFQVSNHSIGELAGKLAKQPLTASYHFRRDELNQKICRVLEQIGESDREILILRYLEELDIGEISEVLEITEAAAKKRQLRALMRIRKCLVDSSGWQI